MPAGAFTILISVNKPHGKDKSQEKGREIEAFKVQIHKAELNNLLPAITAHPE